MTDALVPSNPEQVPTGQMLIYQDGALNLQVRLDGQSVWLTQAGMAELLQTTKQNVSLHIQNIYEEGELSPEATVKQYLTVAPRHRRVGRHQIWRPTFCVNTLSANRLHRAKKFAAIKCAR